MTPDRDDHLLDGCLDEVLGGRTPPDLTARIMQAWAMRRQSGVEGNLHELNGHLPQLPGPPIETLPLEIAPREITAQSAVPTAVVRAITPPPPPASDFAPVRRATVHRPRSRTAAWPWFAAACLAGIGAAVALFTSSEWNTGPGPVVVKPQPKPSVPNGVAQNHNVPAPVIATKPAPKLPSKKDDTFKPAPQIVEAMPDKRPLRPAPVPGELPQEKQPPVAAVNVHELVNKTYDRAISDAEVVSFINTSLTQSWKDNNVQPSPAASDEEWCRRAFIRLLGRIPTVDEVRKFAGDKNRDKRDRLVTQLTDGEQYAEQFNAHWAGVWSNLLIGRTMGQESEKIASRAGLEQYLRQSLAAKKPYYQLVYELLTAEGSAQPGSADYNGAVNFLVASLGQDATLATARTSRLFLGQQLQCAQCHQHPTNDWGQHQYWALNAFLRQAKVEQVAGVTRLTNQDFVDKKNVTTEGEVYFELPNGTIRATGPAFVDGKKIPASGRLDEVNRREELAKLVVTSPQFSPALVNRLWSHYFGYGFTRPVDDIGPSNQPSHPELLSRLSEQFAAHNYDVRKLMKWMVLSDAFGRSSRITPQNVADAPDAGGAPLFSHYYMRQLQAEEAYNSLLIAADLRKKSANQKDLENARIDWLAQFQRPMGTDDNEEETHFNGAVRQSLIMMNGDLMRRAVSSGEGSLIKHLQQSNLKQEEKVEHLFLAALSRQPNKRELEAVKKIAAQHPDNPAAVLEDIWWALLNSNEFILDH
ncbi:hypothetical protein ETAA8_29740 [Anatilimnocola aggregata]|uniref:DUF1553 domain-containing protein n=1 Tax=Anatilimnocola aggregata TaxID=2528021 RepID=A0A517YCB4_9BACT|nr:DUF1549 domain-containing protein [Anatilimnocola aggregata]QDU27883.1 hypothetical protein ETAA8_29740 [Anatilimnocola aggregata]